LGREPNTECRMPNAILLYRLLNSKFFFTLHPKPYTLNQDPPYTVYLTPFTCFFAEHRRPKALHLNPFIIPKSAFPLPPSHLLTFPPFSPSHSPTFSPSQLLNFSPSQLLTFSPCHSRPDTRNLTPENLILIQLPVSSIEHPASRLNSPGVQLNPSPFRLVASAGPS